MRRDEVDVLGVLEEQRGLVVGVAGPAEGQDAVVGEDAHLAGAGRERRAAGDVGERSRRDRLELEPQRLGRSHELVGSLSEQRIRSSGGHGVSTIRAYCGPSSQAQPDASTPIWARAGSSGASTWSVWPAALSAVVAPVGRGGSVSVISGTA